VVVKVGLTVMELPDCPPGIQVIELAPVALAVSVTLSPWQMALSLDVLTVGNGMVVTVKLSGVDPQ
jgi:hypothetical protein